MTYEVGSKFLFQMLVEEHVPVSLQTDSCSCSCSVSVSVGWIGYAATRLFVPSYSSYPSHSICCQELGIYGRLRKISRCGPLSMFRCAGRSCRRVHAGGRWRACWQARCKPGQPPLAGTIRLLPRPMEGLPPSPPASCSALLGQWRDRYAPGEVAEKVKHFFK